MMNELEQRAAVVAEARTWLKTPYHHMARIKGSGVDCAQILIAVYHNVGMIPALDVGYYAQQWALHHSEEIYLSWVEKHCGQVTTPSAGDVVLYKVGRCFSHGAIVVDWPTVIHAVSKRFKCVMLDNGLTGLWENRPHRFYSPWRKEQ